MHNCDLFLQEVLPKSIAAFADLVQDNAKASAAALTADQKKYTPVDSSLIFSQLAGVNKSAAEVEIEVEDVQLATSNQQVNRKVYHPAC